MRALNDGERAALLPLMEAFDRAREAAEDAGRALDREVRRLRRDCVVPADSTLDDSTLEWCRAEPLPNGGQKLVPLKAE